MRHAPLGPTQALVRPRDAFAPPSSTPAPLKYDLTVRGQLVTLKLYRLDRPTALLVPL